MNSDPCEYATQDDYVKDNLYIMEWPDIVKSVSKLFKNIDKANELNYDGDNYLELGISWGNAATRVIYIL